MVSKSAKLRTKLIPNWNDMLIKFQHDFPDRTDFGNWPRTVEEFCNCKGENFSITKGGYCIAGEAWMTQKPKLSIDRINAIEECDKCDNYCYINVFKATSWTLFWEELDKFLIHFNKEHRK